MVMIQLRNIQKKDTFKHFWGRECFFDGFFIKVYKNGRETETDISACQKSRHLWNMASVGGFHTHRYWIHDQSS